MKSTRPSIFLRLILPLLIILTWIGLSGVGGPYFGRIDEVSSNDLSTFLPKNAESTRVSNELAKFQPSGTIPAIVVFESSNRLTPADFGQITAAAAAVQDTGQVKGKTTPPIPSEDGRAAFMLVPLDSNSEFQQVIPQLQSAIADTKPSLTYKFTGPAVFAQDLNKAFAGIDGTLLFVAIGVVFFILLVVYRSPILPVVTLLGAMSALSAAILLVWNLAKAGVVQLNGQVQGILFILVIGAATDYALLYIARYREELTHHESKWAATVAAWKASWEPVVAAGGTVTLGLLCLLVSDLGSNKALGPVGGIGIVLAVLSALTFLPAVMLLLGRKAFWPRLPRFVGEGGEVDYRQAHPVWNRVGELVGRRPRQLWLGLTVILLIACAFLPQLRAQGVAQSDFVLGKSEAREGQALLDRHFPSGSGSPVYALAPSGQLSELKDLLESDSGIAAVTASGATPPSFAPKVVNGDILLQATLKDPASSLPARATVERLRQAAKDRHLDASFGGVSAVQLDTNTASERDLRVIIPLILLAITVVLMLLLRAIVAPLILLLTTVLSFGATLGIAALMFNHVWNFPGADPSVVIFGFVFLVALGIDYNIFLMTRVREETLKQGVRPGTIKALVVTGGVITSAGIVLASTFAALYVIPILFLAEIAFIVAFGVLLDTIIVRSLLVPSLTLEIGRPMWWPSKITRK